MRFDPAVLQLTNRGSYYDTSDEQVQAGMKAFADFLAEDRELFALILQLPGSDYAKGRMAHMLLDQPDTRAVESRVNLPGDGAFSIRWKDAEFNLILAALRAMSPARALKNLLMLTRREMGRVNNRHTRRLVQAYLFERDTKSLDELLVKFRNKIRILVRHVGWPKWAWTELSNFLFNSRMEWGDASQRILRDYPKVFSYIRARELARAYGTTLGDSERAGMLDHFKTHIKALPYEVAMGFRNTFKLPIEPKDLMETAKLSERQKAGMQAAAAREGAQVELNPAKLPQRDLLRMFYLAATVGVDTNIPVEDIAAELLKRWQGKKLPLDLGRVVVIVDMSASMYGSPERPLAPVYTTVELLGALPGVETILWAGGEEKKEPKTNMVCHLPAGDTCLYPYFLQAVTMHPDTLIVISDGYENRVEGALNWCWKFLSRNGAPFAFYQFSPVFDAKKGGARALIPSIPAMPVENVQSIQTNLVVQMINQNPQAAKQALLKQAMPLLIGNKKEALDAEPTW
jgi:hypothetical protein